MDDLEGRQKIPGDHRAGMFSWKLGSCRDLRCRDTWILQELPHVFVLVGNLTDVLEVSGWGNVQLLWDVWPALVSRTGGEMVGMLELCLLWQGNLWRMKVDILTYLALAAVSFVAMVTGGRSSSRRKHKDIFLGENSKFKFGGWDRLAVRSVCSYWGSLSQ